MKYVLRPEVVIDADGPVHARNVMLRILAGAELSGTIYSFNLTEATEK